LKGKWKTCQWSAEKDNLLAGTGDTGYFVVRVNSLDVDIAEGLSDAAEWRKLQETATAKGPVHVVFRTRH
jgi:hypothetical protein